MDDNWVPIIGMLVIFGLPLAGWIMGRVFKHRERMEMLRRGIVPPRDARGWRAYRNQARGFAQPGWTQAGPVPPPAPGYAPPPYEDNDSPQYTLNAGIKTAMVGFALLIGLSFIGYHGGDGLFSPATIRPGPWLLGGLIPMFVGIAQIIIALLSGAQFGYRMPPPGPSGPPPPAQRSYGSAQPGSPGPHYEELARPVPPPDRL